MGRPTSWDDWGNRLREVRGRIAKAEEMVDIIIQDLEGPPPAHAPPAALFVSRVEVRRTHDNWLQATIDGRRAALPPALADLFLALLTTGDASADGLVGWKTKAALAKILRRPGGKPISSSALGERVRRLRKALAEQQINPLLVQSRQGAGYRFALRAQAVAASGLSAPRGG